jgi:hypothetical protein
MTDSSFHVEIGEQIRTARGSLETARTLGDDFLVEIHLGALEELERLAAAHGVVIDLRDTADLTSMEAAQ